MALPATAKRFTVQLSQVDTGVYTTLEVRLAQHPSETDRYLMTRLLAYCVLSNEDPDSVLQFSKGGLSATDEPALTRSSLDGRLLLWCEIGTPGWERVHKASKAAPEVVIFTHHNPQLLLDELAKGRVHRKEELRVWALDGAFLDTMAAAFGPRGSDFDLTVADSRLYVTVEGRAFEGVLRPIEL